ncbi:cell cycle control protein 50A-like [Convolutriloba macropyga]|uniref:cell cycle control protein 50A-like n=1 Tax=Convolutriloba macropyga TaxID=536237 RepID=UPI003F52227D
MEETSRPPSSFFQAEDANSQSNVSTTQLQNNPDENKQKPPRNYSKSEHGFLKQWWKNSVYKFKNQKLPAFRPVLNEKSSFFVFFLASLVFIPIGCVFIKFNRDMKEFSIDYTDCFQTDGTNCKDFVLDIDNQISGAICSCSVNFSLFNHMDNNVMMYYGLKNFYQNHRRYVKSRDDNQLRGEDVTNPSSDCIPYDKAFDPVTNSTLPVAPCGAIANSMFNDTFELECLVENGPSVFVPLLNTGIAWESDKGQKFKNPSGVGSLELRFQGTTKPPNWHKQIWELDTTNDDNNGLENEDLIIWMRTSAFPQFRKPHRRVDHSHESFKNGLPTGQYVLHVNYAYPVTQFKGKKSVILATIGVVGTFDLFMGVMYTIVGGFAFFISVFMIILHLKYSLSKKVMQENQDPNGLSSSTAHLSDRKNEEVFKKTDSTEGNE